MGRLRAAVVGVGNMGRHHARILANMPGVDLVTIIDSDAERAHPLVVSTGATFATSIKELPQVDLAIVATPTDTHVSIASELMARGIHILVEKPLAPSPSEAELLAAAAESNHVILAVGHVERFNAAVSLVAQLVSEPLLMTFERLSPYTPRIRDSVVFDLMVHDLDLACWMAGEYPSRIEAIGASVFSNSVDVASAALMFPSGAVANLTTSRVTQDKVRRICVSEKERFIVSDSVRQDVSIKRETRVEYAEEGDGMAYRQANIVEVPYLDRSGEPLARELSDFVEAVRGEHAPRVDGAAGVAAVRLAFEVERTASRT